MLLLILILTFISVVLLFFPVIKLLFGKEKAVFRLHRYTNTEEIKEEKRKSTHKEFKIGLNVLSKRIGDARFLDGYRKSVQMKLVRAHILLKPEEYITVCIISFFIAALLIFIALSSQTIDKILPFSILGGIIGYIIPSIFIGSKAKKRIRRLNDQLCDAIVLISNSLKAGYSFFQSVDIVTKEMEGPIAEEFGLMQKEANLGLSTEKALENLALRVSSDDLELVVTAVLIQRQVGGNLAEVLDSISSTIRDRLKIKGEIKTVTAQGRASGLIIALLPPVLGFIIFLINPEHISILFKTTLGLVIVGFSIFMELIGIYFINKIIKIEI